MKDTEEYRNLNNRVENFGAWWRTSTPILASGPSQSHSCRRHGGATVRLRLVAGFGDWNGAGGMRYECRRSCCTDAAPGGWRRTSRCWREMSRYRLPGAGRSAGHSRLNAADGADADCLTSLRQPSWGKRPGHSWKNKKEIRWKIWFSHKVLENLSSIGQCAIKYRENLNNTQFDCIHGQSCQIAPLSIYIGVRPGKTKRWNSTFIHSQTHQRKNTSWRMVFILCTWFNKNIFK